jgi:antirestriction protein ArdC
LGNAASAKGYWLNASGKTYPRFYPKGLAVSPFNALVMALHSDQTGSKTNLFMPFSEAKKQGMAVREHERGVPFLYYNWNKYVNRNNPNDVISRADYQTLDAEQQRQYKGMHNREIRILFAADQTTLPFADEKAYKKLLAEYGNAEERGIGEGDERALHIRFNDFLLKMRDNLVPIRTDGSGVAHYDSEKDAVYMPRQKDFEHYNDYVQETLRQIVSATGHQQRLAREGMVMKNGVAPSEDAVRHERLVAELASGVKMLELGLPARLSDESLKHIDFWNRELKENPCLIDAIESDVNNALTVIRKAEQGEKIEYATMRNQRETAELKDQLPKHYLVADEIKQHPDKENKTIVVVIDKENKSADVVLPSGASLEVDNEIKGMNKQRIQKALEREGIETVRFYNPDGALGYRPDDSYFADKQVDIARLKNWSLEHLSTLDASPAIERAKDIGFSQIQMIQDDKSRWALYIKPEGQSGYSVYPDKADINQFFSTLKQSMDNFEAVKMELANKYHHRAAVQPELKVDLFGGNDQNIDLNRIQRVCVFKTKENGILCSATIDGEKVKPRSVTPQQWQRMWVAEDRNSYKTHLAATLFADVLKQGEKQELTSSEKQETETEMKQEQQGIGRETR